VRPSTEEAPLGEQVRVYVRSIRVQGNTVLSKDEIESVVEPYVGRVVSTLELQAIRRQLTLLYIDKGYITSGVVLPDQRIVEGTVTYQVIEGALTSVVVSGEEHLRSQYIRDRFDFSDKAPLSLLDLQQQLQLLQLDPNIERLNAQLSPGPDMGTSTLTLEIQESPPWAWAFRINNHRNPSIGSIQGELDVSYRNLLGLGDVYALRYRKTEGSDEVSLGFSVPLRARGPTLRLGYRNVESAIVEEPFNELDVETELEEWSLGVTQSILRTVDQSFDLTLSMDKRRSDTFIFEKQFQLPNAGNVTALRLIGDWHKRWPDQVLAVRSTFSHGIDALDATVNSQEPDGRFFSWLGQVQFARRFGTNNNELVLRTDVQLSADKLLPLEQFGVGGAYSVRGYRENELVRDNGWVSSAELRFPMLRDRPEIGTLQWAIFADYGKAWNRGSDRSGSQTLTSAGAGLRWAPRPHWYAELYAAVPFRNLDHGDNDLQDSGIHFSIAYRH
jgi:hemolysin activation/secretion protein